MPTRFDTKSRRNLGVDPLPSGYEKDYGAPDITIPPCGIEDVDQALFKLFDKEIAPECGGTDSSPLKKVPIVFAAGEKWAMLKKGRPLRDRNNTLIIPLVTIVRTEVSQDSASDVTGRGINQQVGEIVVRRKLDKSDRGYQSLINKLFLRNQSNLAVNSRQSSSEMLLTNREIGQDQALNAAGGLLQQNLNNNIVETVVVPMPQFYTAKYQVTVWTQYMQHANQIIEKFFASYLPQGQAWRIDTDKGYWFIASVEGGGYSMETNFDDMSQQERFIKHTFNVTIPAYFFVTRSPGSPVPIKRYVSAPTIEFDFTTAPDITELTSLTSSSYVIGSDDPTLPLDLQHNSRADQRTPGKHAGKIYPIDDQDTNDPAFDERNQSQRTIREVGRNSKGETVYTGASLGDLKIIIDGG